MRGRMTAAVLAMATAMLAAEPPRKPAMIGAWSSLVTVAQFQGRWMTPASRAAFLKQDDPDRILRSFAPAARQRVALLALEIGFGPIRAARARPGEAVPLPEKDAELVFHWQAIQGRDSRVYRPVLAVRLVRLKPPPLPPGGLPPLPPGPGPVP